MVHNRIKILRTVKGLTQKEMADQLHKSQSAYSRMESGELTITTDELQDIATILGCQPEDLLKEHGVINILHHNDKAAARDFVENDSQALMTYHKEMMQAMADQQQKANDEMRQFMKEQQTQMALLMKELIAALKK